MLASRDPSAVCGVSVPKQISHIEAIDVAGKAIFGADWIGRVSETEIELIEEYGPAPAKRGGFTIKPCPPDKANDLDRALSRAQRELPQRGAVADWLLDHGLVQPDGCDLDAILAALPTASEAATGKVAQGRPRKYDKIALEMQADVAAGRRTVDWLKKSPGKTLKHIYKADEATCRKAKKKALSSF